MRLTYIAVAFCLTAAAQPPAPPVAQWTRFELNLTSAKAYENAVQDVRVTLELTSPTGARHDVEAFWDGEQIWKARFSPGEIGAWRYRTLASDTADSGLHNRTGSFNCVRYRGDNPLYQHGPLTVSGNKRFLQHADGTPFFWLADTAWAGPMISDAASWNTYLRDRVAKRFTAVQFMGAQNIAAAADAQGRQAFGGRDKIVIDPYFFRRLDQRIDAINEAGLIASPTFLWAAEWHPSAKVLDPGAWLPDDQAILFGRYFTARYGGHHVVWMFAGDHDYRGEKAERWRKLGRAIFGEKPRDLVTVHPAPRMLLKKEFGDEPWLGFLGYQSSHSSREDTVRWIVQGEPAQQWKADPVRPIINIEPIYEAHMNFGPGRLASALDVRQASWWSLLVSPTAGVSYGAHGVWSWETQPAIPMNHYRTGIARPWHEAINHPGSRHMKYVRDFFDKTDWWKLEPDATLLRSQPGTADVQKFVAASRTSDGNTAVIYTPMAQPIELAVNPVSAQWYDPAAGRFSAAKADQGQFKPPRDGDWVLLLQLR